jgi:hypothetical protein
LGRLVSGSAAYAKRVFAVDLIVPAAIELLYRNGGADTVVAVTTVCLRGPQQ